MREEVEELKKEVNEVKEQSFAMELLKDYKMANKRLFIALIVVLSMWFVTIGYLVYILNDIDQVEEYDTIDIQDVETIDNSHIKIGDDIWELLE